MDYQEFLDSKKIAVMPTGLPVAEWEISNVLFPFQRDVVKWAVYKGQCAVFLDTGLGKTPVQVEWARIIGENTLIIAPLSVARQTCRIANDLLDVEVRYVRHQHEVTGEHKLWITNYEMIREFDFSKFDAVVLDESSILKAIDGKTRKRLIKLCQNVRYRLCCTATPAPNDYTELGNHAEFLGVCTLNEMLAMFFINANKEHTFYYGDRAYRKKGSNKGGQEWRLKHHAEEPFFQWLSSWAICMTKPSDLGYDDDGFILPPLNVHLDTVTMDYKPDDQLFFTGLKGVAHRAHIRRETLDKRLELLKGIVNGSGEQWVIWTGLQKESSAVTAALEDAVEVKGSHSPEYKAQAFEDFQDGKFRVLVTKCRIGGFGLNLQNAHKMCFMGLTDSWEMWYQAIRREWRFMQDHPVDVHVILSNLETEIYKNVMRKDAQAQRLREGLIEQVRNYEKEELTLDKPSRVQYNGNVDFIQPEWIDGGPSDSRIYLPDMRQESQEEAKPRQHESPSQVLQPEMQRHSQEPRKEGTNTECRISLSQLREAGQDISQPISQGKLYTQVLQSGMSWGGPTREQKSCMVRWATLPEWLRSDIPS